MNATKRESPRTKIGNELRFKSTYKRYKKNKRVPHSYLTNLKEILGKKGYENKFSLQQTLSNPTKLGPATSIPKSSRFKTFRNTGPGPGEYNLRKFQSTSRTRCKDLSVLNPI